jgi:lipoprotein-anchoring transpeptidase ErfK/SrfK
VLKLEVNIAAQTLRVCDDKRCMKEYLISTAKNGAGELRNSEQTPRGRHIIRAKIGAGLPANTVLVGRRPTGEMYSPGLRSQFPERDWILTRIMWLSGLEPGKNRLGDVDTMQRYIYIHGTPDDVKMGVPGSRGCIRMRNAEIIELFELIPAGCFINIIDR